MLRKCAWFSVYALTALCIANASALAELPPIIDTIKSPITNTLFGERMAALGDQNGDGFDDFIVTDPPTRVRMYYGGSNIIGPVFSIDSCRFYLSAPGDLNNDGFTDFTVPQRFGDTYIRMSVFYGGSFLDAVPEILVGTDTFPVPFGMTFLAKDFRSPGSRDLISSTSYENDSKTLQITSFLNPVDSVPDLQLHPVPPDTGFFHIRTVIVGDFNGDGADDLCTGIAYSEQYQKNGILQFYWGGSVLDTVPDLIIRRPGPNSLNSVYFGRALTNVGDVNGDSFDDVLAGCGDATDSSKFLFLGGPLIDSIPDLELLDNSDYQAAVGDINDDGFADFMGSFSSLFALSTVWIYYGGAQPDEIADIVITHPELPDADAYFGFGMAGLGDVNNDGIDDYGVSYYDYNLYGSVVVFAGQKATGIDEDEEVELPYAPSLKQNYPNPFNPQTTIEYSLQKPEMVSLVVYNTLGQSVKTLVKRKQSTGVHRINWDGKDDLGNPAASGIYLYELVTGSARLSKQMVLLK